MIISFQRCIAKACKRRMRARMRGTRAYASSRRTPAQLHVHEVIILSCSSLPLSIVLFPLLVLPITSCPSITFCQWSAGSTRLETLFSLRQRPDAMWRRRCSTSFAGTCGRPRRKACDNTNTPSSTHLVALSARVHCWQLVPCSP